MLGVYSNPYDTCCIVSTDQPLVELLSKLIPLHLVETQFAKRYRQVKRLLYAHFESNLATEMTR